MKGIILRESEDAFKNAIKRGMKEPELWMYMYSDTKTDYFKNIETREYITYTYKED